MQAAETARSASLPSNDLTAYDLYLRALQNYISVTKETTHEQLDLLNQAIARDPRYGPALALAAVCTYQLHLNGWTASLDTVRRQGLDYAHRAIRVTSNDPFVLACAAAAFGYFRRGHRGVDRVDGPRPRRNPACAALTEQARRAYCGELPDGPRSFAAVAWARRGIVSN
jgi:hypothetical protein